MVWESLAANAAILFGLALILGVFAPRLGEGRTGWGLGIVVLAAASWLQLAEPAALADQIAGMAVAWGAWVAVSGRLGGATSHGFGSRASPTIARAVLGVLGRAALLFLVASPVQYGILQAASIEPVSGLSLVGLALFVLGFLLDALRLRRPGARWGMALVWWGLWIAAASAGWWVAAWTVIGPILATWLAGRNRSTV